MELQLLLREQFKALFHSNDTELIATLLLITPILSSSVSPFIKLSQRDSKLLTVGGSNFYALYIGNDAEEGEKQRL